MKVARIEIEHFRSVEKLSSEPKDLTLLDHVHNRVAATPVTVITHSPFGNIKVERSVSQCE